MFSTGFWFPGKREGTSLPSQHTSAPTGDPDTQQTQAVRETHHASTHSNGAAQSHFPGQNQGGGRKPSPQPASTEERKKHGRFEAECIENRRENKVGGRARPAWPQVLQDGRWALPHWPLGVEESRGLGAGTSLRPGRCWHEVAELTHDSLLNAPAFRAE